MMTSQQQLQALRIFKRVATQAERLTGLCLQQVSIVFNLRGQAAGQAKNGAFESQIRLNTAIFEHDINGELLLEVIAHEVAHICCMKNPRLGRHHNSGWQQLAMALGSSGKRTHDLPLPKARQIRQYLYQSTCGEQITVTSIRHNRIQQGQTYTFGSSGLIHAEGFISEVG